MDELSGILIAVGAILAGLLVLAWAYGDFEKPKTPPTTPPSST